MQHVSDRSPVCLELQFLMAGANKEAQARQPRFLSPADCLPAVVRCRHVLQNVRTCELGFRLMCNECVEYSSGGACALTMPL